MRRKEGWITLGKKKIQWVDSKLESDKNLLWRKEKWECFSVTCIQTHCIPNFNYQLAPPTRTILINIDEDYLSFFDKL